MAVAQIEFSKELNDYIEEWGKKPGGLIMMLHRIQDEFGYVPREAAEKLSRMIGVPLAKIYGVSVDYLMGISDKIEPQKDGQEIKVEMPCPATPLFKEIESGNTLKIVMRKHFWTQIRCNLGTFECIFKTRLGRAAKYSAELLAPLLKTDAQQTG